MCIKDDALRDDWDEDFKQNYELGCDIYASQLKILTKELHTDSVKTWKGKLTLVVEPATMRQAIVKCNIAKGSLMLVPVSQNIACAKKVPLNVVHMGYMGDIDKVSVYAYAQSTHKNGESGPEKKDVQSAKKVYEFFAPFWCVQATPKSADANMAFETVKMPVKGNYTHSGDYYITILTNTRDLVIGDCLKFQQFAAKDKYPPHDSMKARKI